MVQPLSSIRSLAGAIGFEQRLPESANLDGARSAVADAAAAGARIVAFPELYPGPSARDSDLERGQVLGAMSDLASTHGVAVAFGGLRPGGNGRAHNSYTILDGRSGACVVQDKVLPAIGETTAPGAEAAIADIDGVRVGVAICWEAWFPELARARVLAGADLVLCPAGAVVGELAPQWLNLVRARASENVCFTSCSVNLLGVEPGMAGVFGPEGPLGALEGQGMLVSRLDLDRLDALRAEDEQLTPIKRFATIPGLLRALPERLVLDELEAFRRAVR